MRERLEQLLGPHRARDVGHDVPRRLRPDPARARRARLGYTLELHDLRPGRPAAARQALPRGARQRPEALHARAASTAQISNAKNQLVDARRVRGARRRRSSTRPSPRSTSSTSGGCFASNAMDFDDLLMLTVDVLERFPEAREQLAEGVPPRPRRRVPGHEPRAVPAAAAARGEHGNVFAVGDPTSRSTRSAAPTSATSSTSSATSRARGRSRSSRTTARRTRSSRPRTRVIAHNRERKPKPLWTELGEGEPVQVVEVEDEHAEARFVAAEIERLVEEGLLRAARSRSSTGRTRRAACSRTCSSARTSPTR